LTAVAQGEIGAHRKRIEDPRLIQGQGQYVDDIRLPGTLEIAFVRSAFAHARIRSIDLGAARGATGVAAAWAGAEVEDVPRLPNRIAFETLKLSPLPPLAQGVVTCIGYPVAAATWRATRRTSLRSTTSRSRSSPTRRGPSRLMRR
jgi:aerobic carbon-monoxide dehydrogenase large subunit